LFNGSNKKPIRDGRGQESDAYVRLEKEKRSRDGMNGKKREEVRFISEKRKYR